MPAGREYNLLRNASDLPNQARNDVGWIPTAKKFPEVCKSEQRTILTASTINEGTVRKSDTDQKVGRALWAPSILSPLFSSETFSLTRGALHAEETRPFFLMRRYFPREKGHSSLPMYQRGLQRVERKVRHQPTSVSFGLFLNQAYQLLHIEWRPLIHRPG